MLHSLYDYLIDCPIKKTFGIDCFGCGFQRSVLLLTEGKLLESIKMYPATLPMLLLWFFTMAHLVFKFKHGARAILYLFIFCVGIILANYIFKIVNGQII